MPFQFTPWFKIQYVLIRAIFYTLLEKIYILIINIYLLSKSYGIIQYLIIEYPRKIEKYSDLNTCYERTTLFLNCKLIN